MGLPTELKNHAEVVGKYNKTDLEYWEQEKLDELFPIINEKLDYMPFFSVTAHNIPFPPELDDLVNIHKLIRSRKVFTVLEFGSGYSTIVICDALAKNKADYDKLKTKPKIRKENMFEVHSVETDKLWTQKTRDSIPKELRSHSKIHLTALKIGVWGGGVNGRLCHYYDKLPDIVPDFVYLDGPAPADVKGSIRGITFGNKPERTVMAGDLLFLEPTFVPGTFILVDGRTNNARFLKNNFQRTYQYKHDEKADIHTFELIERPLGVFNKRLLRYCLGEKGYKKYGG